MNRFAFILIFVLFAFSWAGGRYMQLSSAAEHTFVWGYSNTAITISTPNAFLIFPEGTPGKAGIGTPDPNELLEIGGNGRAFFGYGGGTHRKGLLIDGNEEGPFARLEAYDYGTNTGLNLVFNTVGNGNVGIGTISPSKRLYVNGSAGGTTAWNASDVREKTEIKPIENALENILKIRGISYRWKKGDEKETQGFDNKAHFGVIAQEVEAVYPELVDNPGITEKRKHVEYNGLVGI